MIGSTMKKLISLLIILASLLTMAACDAPSEGEGSTEPPAATALTLASGGVSEYMIVRSDKDSKVISAACVALNKAFEAKTGISLTIASDFEADIESPYIHKAQDCEIVVGSTKRQGKYFEYDDSSLGSFDYDITVIGKRVLIAGGSDIAVTRGVDAFISAVLSGEKTDVLELPMTYSLKYEAPASEKLTIMSLNLLATDTEYGDADHTIKKRQPRIKSIIEKHAPTSIGLQECSAVWRTWFNSVGNAMNYKRVGASKNQKISIFYDTTKLRAIENGSIWLTEKPDSLKISEAWNGTTERLAMYVLFEVIETGERFVHVNTHIGFDNPTLALNQAKVVRDYCESLKKTYDCPVVCTGDFNFDKTSACYTAFTENIMCDTKDLAAKARGTGSFNKLGAEGYPKANAIDQVMVSKDDFLVYTYDVDYTKFDGEYFYSDHYAVVATLEMTK